MKLEKLLTAEGLCECAWVVDSDIQGICAEGHARVALRDAGMTTASAARLQDGSYGFLLGYQPLFHCSVGNVSIYANCSSQSPQGRYALTHGTMDALIGLEAASVIQLVCEHHVGLEDLLSLLDLFTTAGVSPVVYPVSCDLYFCRVRSLLYRIYVDSTFGVVRSISVSSLPVSRARHGVVVCTDSSPTGMLWFFLLDTVVGRAAIVCNQLDGVSEMYARPVFMSGLTGVFVPYTNSPTKDSGVYISRNGTVSEADIKTLQEEGFRLQL